MGFHHHPHQWTRISDSGTNFVFGDQPFFLQQNRTFFPARTSLCIKNKTKEKCQYHIFVCFELLSVALFEKRPPWRRPLPPILEPLLNENCAIAYLHNLCAFVIRFHLNLDVKNNIRVRKKKVQSFLSAQFYTLI